MQRHTGRITGVVLTWKIDRARPDVTLSAAKGLGAFADEPAYIVRNNVVILSAAKDLSLGRSKARAQDDSRA